MTDLWVQCGWPDEDDSKLEFGNVTLYVSMRYAERCVGNHATINTRLTLSGNTLDELKADAILQSTDAIQAEYLRKCEELHALRGKAHVLGIQLPGEK